MSKTRTKSKKIAEMSIADVLALPLYRKTLKSVMRRLELERQTAAKNGPLKRHPFDHLKECGLWSAPELTRLYSDVLDKTARGVSASVRDFVRAVGTEAFNKTMAELIKHEEEQGNGKDA